MASTPTTEDMGEDELGKENDLISLGRDVGLIKNEKLILALELDNLLVNTVKLADLKEFELEGIGTWTIEDKELATRLRPGATWFLKKMEQLFKIYIVTHDETVNPIHQVKFIKKDIRGDNNGIQLIKREDGAERKAQYKKLKQCIESWDTLAIKLDIDLKTWDFAPNVLSLPSYKYLSDPAKLEALKAIDEDSEKQRERFDALFHKIKKPYGDWSPELYRDFFLSSKSEPQREGHDLEQSGSQEGEEEPREEETLTEEQLGAVGESSEEHALELESSAEDSNWAQDDDDNLAVAAVVLVWLHDYFFRIYRAYSRVPDMNLLMFIVKKQALKDRVICVRVQEKSRMVYMHIALSLGARLTDTIVAEETTHVVVDDSAKVKFLQKVAKRRGAKVVKATWLDHCHHNLSFLEEDDFDPSPGHDQADV